MENYYYKLTDICEFQGGSQPPKEQWTNHYKDGYIRMLQIRDFTQNRVDEEFVKITNTIKTCNKDDVLIARYGASIGKILTGLEGAYNVAIMKSIPNESILNKRYMYYYFNTQYFQHNIKNVGSRAAQAGFNKTELESMQIYAPSLETQKKIVEVLDKAQELIDKRKEQIKDMDELVKSRFIEMFGNIITNSYNWKTIQLKDISVLKSGGTPTRSKPEYFEGDIPWITTVALGKNLIDEKDAIEFITQGAIDNSSTKLIPQGSLLFGMRVGVGKISVNSVPMCTNQDIMAITNIDTSKYNLIFMKKVIESYSEYFNNQKRGATIQGIKSDTLKEIKIPIIDRHLQNEFADFVNQIDKLKSEMETSLKELEDNFNSLMQKAFKGELF